MKKLALVTAIILSLGATLALAANSNFLGTYLLTGGTMTPPSGSSAGYALVYPSELRGINVTIGDERDGSAGDALDNVSSADAYAWCYNSKSPVGAATGGWSRYPQLDLSMRNTDAGSGAESNGKIPGVSGSTATANQVHGVECSRIYYTTGFMNLAWDAGTLLVHRVTITELD